MEQGGESDDQELTSPGFLPKQRHNASEEENSKAEEQSYLPPKLFPQFVYAGSPLVQIQVRDIIKKSGPISTRVWERRGEGVSCECTSTLTKKNNMHSDHSGRVGG